MKKTAWIAVMCLLLGAWASAALAADAPKTATPKVLGVGDMVADFNLTDGLSGAPVSFSKDILGKTKLTAISFMNTACSACAAEIRFFSQLAGKYPELRLVAIAVDSRGEAVVKSYNDHNKFNASYVLDPEFTQPPKYGFNFTPAVLLVDKSGKIVHVKGGFNPMMDPDDLTKTVESFVK